MKALAIDSAVPRLEIAAKNDGRTVSAVYDIGTKQSETLLDAVAAVLEKAGIAAAGELAYTALCAGPGSFTGLRLAYSALKAVELAAGVPVYGIPTLEVYAETYRGLPFYVVPAIDARKERFYAAVYAGEREVVPAGDYEPRELAERLAAREQSCRGRGAEIAANAGDADGGGAAAANGAGGLRTQAGCAEMAANAGDADGGGAAAASGEDGLRTQAGCAEIAANAGNADGGGAAAANGEDGGFPPARDLLICGPDAKLLYEKIKPLIRDRRIFTLPFRSLTTESLFAAAEKRIAAGIPPLADFDGPLYLRASEAEQNLNS